MAEVNTVGLLETSSVARGIEASDAMLKTAAVELLVARSICSGKYLVAVSGDVASVKAAVAAGVRAAEGAVIEEGVIPQLHPSILPAIGQSIELEADRIGALGIVETFSAATVIRAADAAAKSADVSVFRIHLAMALGGKGLALMTGTLADVEVALEAGAAASEGMLVAKSVIPSPDRELFREYI